MSPKDDRSRSRAGLRGVQDRLAAGLIGHERLIERLMIAALAGGHVLIEGAPGLAKTRAVNWLARAVGGSFARVQCTPDLMPADLTGTAIFRPDTGGFEFVRGPVFHNVVLVDEINRAPPKVQSALLEAMAEGQVTSGGETHRLPDPFLAVATQNPIEHEGTYPLPEAQLDRFLFHVALDLPGAADERRILDLVEAESRGDGPGGSADAPAPIGPDMLLEARREAMQVHLSPVLRDYIVRLVIATRGPELAEVVDYAVSPRGSLALAAAAKARAWLDGRDHALPDDVQALAGDALAHRLVLSWSARAEGRTARALVAEILDRTHAL